MTVYHQIDTLQQQLDHLRSQQKTIGFVPTMGALHDGHLSLINLSKQHADVTIASVFINPTQFNDPEDFAKYPVSTNADIALLEQAGCDLVFMPTVAVMYPGGTAAPQHYDLGEIETILEGKHRPGHFQGVAQVVHRLLDIVQPHHIFLGRKDYQQCLVIKRLVEIIGSSANVITGATHREPSGLAMSSRNMRLSPGEKTQATAIYKALQHIAQHWQSTPFDVLENEVIAMLQANGFGQVDYVAIADAETLQPAEHGATNPAVALVAAYLGQVRLIDNIVLAK